MQAFRYILRKKGETDESNVEIKVLTAEQSEDKDTHFKDPESGVELEEVEKKPLLEWLAENYKKVGPRYTFFLIRRNARSGHCSCFRFMQAPHFHVMDSHKWVCKADQRRDLTDWR